MDDASQPSRLRRVAALWSWLPAFRAVAEAQHLPTAAERLHVSASALSRTVALVEEAVGEPLFRRVGRRIELNAAGEQLLSAVRDAMRLVHEGLLVVSGTQLVGRLYVSSAGVMTTAYVAPALEEMRGDHPELVPHLSSNLPAEINPMLLQGRLDVAFLSTPIRHDELTLAHLGSATNGVYCGPGHPLFRRRKVTPDDLSRHAFVAPLPDERGHTHEGWPDDLERVVGMHIAQMHVGVEVCARGSFLAVLPDAIATSLGRGQLRRLPAAFVPPTQMYAVHRPTLGPPGRAETTVDAVRERIGRAG